MNTGFTLPSPSKFIESFAWQEIVQKLREDVVQRQQRGGAAPFESIALLKAHKIGALRIPQQLGGRGLSIEQLFEVLIQISAIDSDVTQILRSHFQFVEDVLRSADQKFQEIWLGKVLQGAIIGNAFTEMNKITVASGAYQTRMSEDQYGLHLNGEKIFTTGTLYADYISVRVGSEQSRAYNVVIPKNRAGVTVIDDWDGIGQCYTASGTTRFDHVTVYPDEVIPVAKEQVSFKPFTQLYLHAIIAGILKAVEGDAVIALQKRGRSFSFANTEIAAQDPIFLEKIGEISAAAFAAEAIVLRAASQQDIAFLTTVNGVSNFELSHAAAQAATQAKIAIEPLALATASKIFDVVGASATRRSVNLDRHWRNIRTLASHNPASLKAVAMGKLLVQGEHLPNNVYF
jgi:alkylation response protein AidB-like acyl-CoA dehydrogenase